MLSVLNDLTQIQPIELVVQTVHEPNDPQTLAVLVAVSINGVLTVQPYLADTALASQVEGNAETKFFDGKVVVRPSRQLTPDLCLATFVADLWDVHDARPTSREVGEDSLHKGEHEQPFANVSWNATTGRWKAPQIRLLIICHKLTSHLLRAIGHRALLQMLVPQTTGQGAAVKLKETNQLNFAVGSLSVSSTWPTVEYVQCDKAIYGIQVETRDLKEVYGGGAESLEQLRATFLHTRGNGTSAENSSVTTDSAQLVARGLVDVVDVMRIHDAMKQLDSQIRQTFEPGNAQLPAMRSTVGARVNSFVEVQVLGELARTASLRSRQFQRRHLGQGQRGKLVSVLNSRYGEQPMQVHGGLLINRSPTQLWHEAPTHLRDVDMKGCYPSIMRDMHVYMGRPLLWEPGRDRTTLATVVQQMSQSAPSDGWMIWVTGDVDVNALIPSTRNARTRDNYTRWRAPKPSDSSGARLYAKRIEAGIVTADTWLAIKLLPSHLRVQYENLSVESVLFYDKRRIGDSPEQFDELYLAAKTGQLPWGEVFNFATLTAQQTRFADESNVAYRFALGRVVVELESLRRAQPKGSPADHAMKVQLNSIYGILSSKRLSAGNLIAANVVTACARARAFALAMSLNGILLITDGVVYRRDMVPAKSFRELLQADINYPLHHCVLTSPQSPSQVPLSDAEFARWYCRHAAAFFEVDVEPYRRLFELELEHKLAGEPTPGCFDGLACDGNGQHIKCLKNQRGWIPIDARLRGYGEQSKSILVPRIVEAYRSNRITDTFPCTTDRVELGVRDAISFVAANTECRGQLAIVPVGFIREQPKTYRAIKVSGFVFDTPRQERCILRQASKFERSVGPLDLLALRRRKHSSLDHILQKLSCHIRSGGRDATKLLNLHAGHLSEKIRESARRSRKARNAKQATARRKLTLCISIPSGQRPMTGLQLDR